MLENGISFSIYCLCKQDIPIDKVLKHCKDCPRLKAVFGALADTLSRTIDEIKDSNSLNLFCGLLSSTQILCKAKMKGNKMVNAAQYPDLYINNLL